MAESRVCDICGAPDAKAVNIAIEVEGAVHNTVATSTMLSMDACEAHWLNAMKSMAEKVIAKLLMDIPIAREVHMNYAEQARVGESLKDSVKTRDAIDEKATGADKVKRLEAEAQVEKAVADLKALEEKRLALIRSV